MNDLANTLMNGCDPLEEAFDNALKTANVRKTYINLENNRLFQNQYDLFDDNRQLSTI